MKMARTKKSKFRGKVAKNTQKQKTAGTNYGHLKLPKNVSIFKEEPGGRATLDFIPYVVTDEHHMDRDVEMGIAIPGDEDTDLWYKKPYRLHRNIGSENKSIVCPSTWGKPCPICEYKAAKLKDGAEYDEVRDLKPSLRNLYFVIPLGMKDYKEEIHIWDISQFLFQEALNEELDENEEYCVFPDIEDGLSLRIRFSEEKFMNNSFAKTSRIDFEERDSTYDDSILDDLPRLDDCLERLTYKEIESIFHEMESEDEQTSEEESKPAPAKVVRRKKKTAKPKQEEVPKDDTICPACEGEGVDSNGEVCQECQGSCMKDSAKPKKTKPKVKPKKPKEEANRCPYGHRFGIDTDEYDECDECDVWDDCIEVKENN
jgi:hypothetical protein